jgi:hypothetical protein
MALFFGFYFCFGFFADHELSLTMSNWGKLIILAETDYGLYSIFSIGLSPL